MVKIEPAVTQLMYDLPDGTSYIDLAKDLSQVNRRLYRQGYTYVVQDIQMHSVIGLKMTDVSLLEFATAGNSFMVHNAWKKAFAAWRKQVRDNIENQSVQGKWADFKIYLDDVMEDSTILNPLAGDGAVYQAGEWAHSQLVFDDDGTERKFKMHLIGSSNLTDTNNESAIGLIEEYQRSRRTVQEYDPAGTEFSDSIYAKLHGTDEMTDMIVDLVEGDNDQPPYDHDQYPGGDTNADAAVPTRILTCTGGQGSAMVAGFIAPCGLIQVENSRIIQNGDFLQDAAIVTVDAASEPTRVIITMAAGPYRGVLAAPMGQ